MGRSEKGGREAEQSGAMNMKTRGGKMADYRGETATVAVRESLAMLQCLRHLRRIRRRAENAMTLREAR